MFDFFPKMEWHWFHFAALAGFLAHVYFSFIETLGWRLEEVKKIAPSWFAGLEPRAAEQHVAWAKRLAFNIGVYNLMLAIGFGWTFIANPAVGRQLAGFFGIWLLGAAAAALHTKVTPAFYIQGILGVVLLVTAVALRSPI